MSEKICYQLTHPEDQTPCFKDAGSEPCSDETCAVYAAIAVSTLARSLGSEKFREHIANHMLHYVCRMSKFSPDNHEFRERTGYKG